MRKKSLWLLGVGFLVCFFGSVAVARMAEDFEIPAKREVKPVAPVRASVLVPATSRAFADGGNSSRSFRDPVTGIKFVKIPQGCFKMGQSPGTKAELIANEGQDKYDKHYNDELPRHRVCVDSFWLAEKEVTIALWRRFVKAMSYKTDVERDTGGQEWTRAYKSGDGWKWRVGYYWDKTGFSQESDYPVTCVSFNDVEKFIAWLNRKGSRKYRLPTEAEREYACRGGTTTIRFWGDDPDDACAYANVADQMKNEDNRGWYKKHECRDGYYYTAPVGSFKANPFGLYDMLGNVWEWCSDKYASDYYNESPINNPPGSFSGEFCVVRGGGWSSRPAYVRAAIRYRNTFATHCVNLGFRLALSSGQE